MASIAQQLELSQKRITEIADTAAERAQTTRRLATQRVEIATGSIRDTALANAYAAGATALGGLATAARLVPFGGRVRDQLNERAQSLTKLEDALVIPPIENYDELNVRQVGDALEGLDAWSLEKVRRYEASNKNRKTVLGAVERLLR